MTLIITGCVKPPQDGYRIKLLDSNEREAQYIKSLEYYITKTNIKNIVFCENSNYKLKNDINKLISNKNFEFLSFEGNQEKSVRYGKGYGEGEIMQYAFENSKLISRTNYIAKVTGRLIVKNINTLVRFANQSNGYFWFMGTSGGVQWVNTRFYMMPKKLYMDVFIGYKEVDDRAGFDTELMFYHTIKNSQIEYRKFFVCPRIEGTSGTDGVKYNGSVYKNIIDTVKLHTLNV